MLDEQFFIFFFFSNVKPMLRCLIDNIAPKVMVCYVRLEKFIWGAKNDANVVLFM